MRMNRTMYELDALLIWRRLVDSDVAAVTAALDSPSNLNWSIPRRY
jgi:hypothetical protein